MLLMSESVWKNSVERFIEFYFELSFYCVFCILHSSWYIGPIWWRKQRQLFGWGARFGMWAMITFIVFLLLACFMQYLYTSQAMGFRMFLFIVSWFTSDSSWDRVPDIAQLCWSDTEMGLDLQHPHWVFGVICEVSIF